MTHCEVCNEKFRKQELSTCPCGKRVCGECQDYGIYSDEVCCKPCAEEIRKGWTVCAHLAFGEPYENDMGYLIEECEQCGFPRLAVPSTVTTEHSPSSGGDTRESATTSERS